ncbi:MAG TPA: hypothetical protein P5525_03915 [Candidatus Paceibacterota bacterium]|nr:hypothetical protein [Candidatus Paceibacterota bacterium]
MTELLLRISAKAKGLAPMIQSLAKVMFQAKLEPGCVDCRVYVETENPQSLVYVEQWVTQQDFESGLVSRRFGTLLSIMESARQAPELEVRTVSEQRGLDYVRSVRLPPDGTGGIVDPQATGANMHPRSTQRREHRLPRRAHSSIMSWKGNPL